jgi:hypothetical protein
MRGRRKKTLRDFSRQKKTHEKPTPQPETKNQTKTQAANCKRAIDCSEHNSSERVHVWALFSMACFSVALLVLVSDVEWISDSDFEVAII